MRHPAPAFEILLEDDHLVALVKPAGLPTANAAKGADSVFTLLQSARPRDAFLGVVSRLDAPVSGVLVLAKTRAAAADLARQFRERSVEKRYTAVVEGRFPAPLDRWVEWHDVIRRQEGGRANAAEAEDGGDEEPAEEAGKPAHARARVVRRAGEVSLVELEPTTGRRHQLRQQLSSRRCPIVGDRRYGSRLPFDKRLPLDNSPPLDTRPSAGFRHGGGIALHAASLSLDHPVTGERLLLEAPLPAAWRTRFPALFAKRYR